MKIVINPENRIKNVTIEQEIKIKANGLKKADRWEVKYGLSSRSIQLYDTEGNELSGEKAYWEGSFDCSSYGLTSLKGSPVLICGDLIVHDNPKLKNLVGPKLVCGGMSADKHVYKRHLKTNPSVKKDSVVFH